MANEYNIKNGLILNQYIGNDSSLLYTDISGVVQSSNINPIQLENDILYLSGEYVQHTELSAWNGSTNLTTLGTVISGHWNSTPINDDYLLNISWNKVLETPTTLSGYGITDTDKFKTYSGFVNRSDSTIEISALGLFTFTPNNSVVFANGIKHILSTSQSISITNDQNLTYLFIDHNGILQKSLIAWDLASINNAPLAIVFKDNNEYALTDERHSYLRNTSWHRWAHNNIGAVWNRGFAGIFTNNSINIEQGVIYDEDISFDSITSQSTTSLWYRNGSDGMRLIRKCWR